jgi:hypothetical protein
MRPKRERRQFRKSITHVGYTGTGCTARAPLETPMRHPAADQQIKA